MRYLLAISSIALLSGCMMSEDRATRAIQAQGMDSIVLGGPALFSCSKDDGVSRSFTARTADGKAISGTVCGGLIFKGATVRID